MAKGESGLDSSVASWPVKKNLTHTALKLDLCVLAEKGFQVVREYGTDLIQFEQDLDQVSGGQLFYSNRIGSICHRYSVLPESDNLSEKLSCGGFHTDFMFQIDPPEYIALLCLKADPRHPIYGRNQIVSWENFREKIYTLFGLTEDDLKQRQLPYDLPGHGKFKQALLYEFHGNNIFRFHELFLDSDLIQDHQVKGVSWQAALHAVFMDVAHDICLNRGDLLIVSNHHALHRRSECSIAYNETSGQWDSREMASIRFNL